MKVVVGLGNPGNQYTATKHNVGFWVVDELSRRLSIATGRDKFRAHVGEGRVGSEKMLLCKPQTFMNLSGESLREVVSYYRDLHPEDVIVVYDDMDFPPGEVRLREKGSAGGHNGMKSVIHHLGTDTFPRVRVGIGRPPGVQPVIDHVLSPFSAEHRKLVDAAVERAADAIEFSLKNSFTLAMNRYNASR